MAVFDKNFKEVLTSQLVSIGGGTIAGTILAAYTNKLLLIPGMLILLPGFLEMRGNISGSFSARLTSGLFLKIVKPQFKKTKIISGNLLSSSILAVVVSFILGLTAFLFNYFVTGIITPKIIAIPLIAGILANAVEIPLTLFMTFYLFKKGHDPDNVMGPFVTSTGDITSIAALLITLVII